MQEKCFSNLKLFNPVGESYIADILLFLLIEI